MIINIGPDEVRVCTNLATERWLTKFDSVDKPNYAAGKLAGRLEHELLANIRANISEWAVAKHYSLTWSVPWYPNYLHPLRKHLADVGPNHEVRTVRTQTAIPFWEKDIGKYIYGTKILDDNYYSQVEVYGNFYSNDYMTDQYWDQSISGWRVPVEEIVYV